jgi:MFS family permease
MDFYWVTFLLVFKVALILTYCNYKDARHAGHDGHDGYDTFQSHYLIVYTLAYFADWLKGPYVYALYEAHGLSESDIALLFVAGFAASGVSGPLVGSLGDRFGRKKLSIAYFLIYITSTLCKPFPNFSMLLLGRVLSGIGTSLLTTAFESWMVAEHRRRKYPQDLLDDTFAKATLCNSGSAVVAGLLAQASADHFGFLAPFFIALVPLTIGLVYCCKWWDVDQPGGHPSVLTGFQDGLDAMDTNLWILALSQSFFCGAMYTFVFLWTPALDMFHTTVPFGLIFATFMAMVSIGSALFKRWSHRVEQVPFLIFGIAFSSSVATIWTLGHEHAVFISFLLFELSCGLMFPTYGSLRSLYIPDEHRTTIMNIYRIPLNVFVVIMLLNKKYMSLEVAFSACCVAHLVCLALWKQFVPTNNYEKGQRPLGLVVDDFSELDDY